MNGFQQLALFFDGEWTPTIDDSVSACICVDVFGGRRISCWDGMHHFLQLKFWYKWNNNLWLISHAIIIVLALLSSLYNFWINAAWKQKVRVFIYSFVLLIIAQKLSTDGCHCWGRKWRWMDMEVESEKEVVVWDGASWGDKKVGSECAQSQNSEWSPQKTWTSPQQNVTFGG